MSIATREPSLSLHSKQTPCLAADEGCSVGRGGASVALVQAWSKSRRPDGSHGVSGGAPFSEMECDVAGLAVADELQRDCGPRSEDGDFVDDGRPEKAAAGEVGR